MESWTEENNPYRALGLEKGADSTHDEIKKAYRQMALTKHPDKQRHNPNAHEEFQAIKDAYSVLSDEKARAALDDWMRALTARRKQEACQSDKRRKMREDLERRERASASDRGEEAMAHARLKMELERLRQKAAEAAKKRHEQVAVATAAAAAATAAGAVRDADSEIQDQLKRTLKVSWQDQGQAYSTEELRALFAVHGEVEDVIIKTQSKKKSKCTALVVMRTREASMAAVNSLCGHLSNPLLVTPLLKGESVDDLDQPTAASDALRSSAQHLSTQDAPIPITAPQDAKPLFPGSSTPSSFKPLFPTTTASTSKPLFPMAQSTFTFPVNSQGSQAAAPSTTSFPSSFPSSFPGQGFPTFQAAPRPSSNGLEQSVLEKMMRAAEREKQLAELKAAEEADE